MFVTTLYVDSVDDRLQTLIAYNVIARISEKSVHLDAIADLISGSF